MTDNTDYEKLKWSLGQQLKQSSIVSSGSSVVQNILGPEDELRESYCTKVWLSAANGLCHTLFGAVVITIVFFSMQTDDPHAATFAIAYHLFVAEAILSFSYINGWSTPMRKRHRRLAHGFLQFCALGFSGYGVFIVIAQEELPNWKGIHGVSGLVTLLLTAMNWALSPFVIRRIHGAAAIHMLCGIFCFLMSSLCLGSGVATPPFTKWAGLTIVPMLFVFITFYSIFTAFTLYKKWAQT